MSYVRCLNHRAYLHFKDQPLRDEPISLTIGRIYKTLPLTQHEHEHGWLRIVDDTGEDYLFPATYFEPVDLIDPILSEVSASVTIHLSPLLKGILHAGAAASNKSLSALVRKWLDERLDLPANAS
jgi:hypothetical protein